ncbi:MAG: hypothetical protein KAI25_11555, partial [Hyphomicrobiaceae bacterium]|nr:hypothetical protein [Hyphomicrobiaceae bacterium]
VLQASAALLTATGAGSYTDVLKLDLNELGNRKRYVRLGVTPDLSRAATDTAVVVPTVLLGGAEVLPAV